MKHDIMIVDDSTDQLQLMRMVFKMVSPELRIVTASDGNEALNALRAGGELPKVILLDLRMPGKSGQEVLREIKMDPSLKLIPVCAFSNGDVQQDICECYELGASFYFQKPTGLNELKKFANTFSLIWFNIASLCD